MAPARIPADDDADLTEVLRSLGVPAAAIERARERGYPEGAIFDAFIAAGAAQRSVSLRELEEMGGPSIERSQELLGAFGFAVEPDAPALTPDEAEALRELRRLEGVWPHELALQLARLYGRLVGRIAHASVELFRLQVEPQLRRGGDRAAGLRAIESTVASLYPIAPPLLIAVFRRAIERELQQMAVRGAEAAVGELPDTVEISLLFCDLKDFTAYAYTAGDERAARAVGRLTEIVAEEGGAGSRLLKSIGDGFMLVYDEPGAAVAAGLRIIAATRPDRSPIGVHASVHHGTAVAREGDYFGGAVNLAARLLAHAGRGELVATEAAVERCRERFAWRPAAPVEVRGVAEPVAIYRLAAQGPPDPR